MHLLSSFHRLLLLDVSLERIAAHICESTVGQLRIFAQFRLAFFEVCLIEGVLAEFPIAVVFVVLVLFVSFAF